MEYVESAIEHIEQSVRMTFMASYSYKMSLVHVHATRIRL